MEPTPNPSHPSERPRLSVVVITRDEAHNLPRLLDSVEGLADEVVVFDSGSVDGTVEIAKARGARVIDCEWAGWSATKNQANTAAKGDWILSLDADEALTATSAEAIRQMVSGPLRTSDGAWRVGQIDRLTRYIDRWVHHSGWRPDRKLRLWPAGAAHWEGAIHERPVFDGPVSVERIAGDVEHHSYPSSAHHLEQIERFGKVWAQDRFDRGLQTPLLLVCLKVCAQWLKTYLLKRGFLDGATGWTVARRSAWATWRKHARLRLMHRGDPPAPSKVLIARTDALGDLVVTLPLVHALKAQFPGVQVDVLVRRYASPIAHQATGVDHVVEWPSEGAGKTAAVDLLRAGGYDAIVHAFPEPSVLRAATAAGIPIRMATGRRWASVRHATHRCWDSRKASGGHEAWHGLRLLLPLGIDVDREFRTRKSLIAPQPDGAVQGILDTLGQPPILLHPGSHGSAGNWPADHFAQLATRLADAGHPVCITGTESERERFAPHLPDHPRITELSGQLDLMQLMALQSHAALVVASSTGPLHTAASLGTPVLGLYGSEAPAWPDRWAPIGPRVSLCVTEAHLDDGTLDLSVTDVMEAGLQALNVSGRPG